MAYPSYTYTSYTHGIVQSYLLVHGLPILHLYILHSRDRPVVSSRAWPTHPTLIHPTLTGSSSRIFSCMAYPSYTYTSYTYGIVQSHLLVHGLPILHLHILHL